MNIVFDFDGTIANSTPYHKAGWTSTLKELNIKCDLNVLLPYEANLQERFDSYRRIKKGFMGKDDVKNMVQSFFLTENEDLLANKIMDLKESLTITKILEESLPNTLNSLGENLMVLIEELRTQGEKIGVISSTRETIINCFLYKCGILDYFDFVIGEESLTDRECVLRDKPNPYAKVALKKINQSMDVYIGDNKSIDGEFAEACGVAFVFADYKTNFIDLKSKITLQK